MTAHEAEDWDVDVSPIDARSPIDEEVIAPDRARLARAVNDLEAAKVRVQRDAALAREETRSKLVSELLPVLDNFDRAIVVAESNGDAPSVVEGMRLIHRQLERV
jgi:molecular chaperone GrpE